MFNYICVETNVNGVVITVFPVYLHANRDTCNPAVQLETATAYFDLTYFDIFSN